MDAALLSALASLATILSLLAAGVFAYFKFRHTETRQAGNDMFDKALRIIQNYETETARKDREILNLQRQLGSVQERLRLIEQRNTRLVQELAAAYRVPTTFVEMRLDGTLPSRVYPAQSSAQQGDPRYEH